MKSACSETVKFPVTDVWNKKLTKKFMTMDIAQIKLKPIPPDKKVVVLSQSNYS